MATESAGSEGVESSVERTAEVDRPRFRGCVFCYAAAWVAYAVRRVRG